MEGSAKRRVVRVAREERRAIFFASRFARARARVPRFGPANRSVLQAKVDIFQQEGMKHGCR